MVSAIQLTVGVCYNMSFSELCNHDETDAIISNQWMVSIQSDCTIAYTTINNSSNQQHQQIRNCDIIYRCWIVHNNKSVCLYFDSNVDAADHNRLTLASMKVVEGGNWTFIDDDINVFTLFSRVYGQLPFFTGLYQAIDNDEETATFVIGNNARLSKVIVRFDGNRPSYRQPRVCARKITDITVTDHLIVTCDDQTTRVELLESWHDFNISYTRLLRVLRSGLSKSYISDSGEVGMIVVTNKTSNSTHVSYWLAYREHPDLEKCVDISATFTDGLLVEDDNSSVLFFAILNGNLTVVNESCNGLHTIATNVCHSGDCYLYHTKHLLYISDHQNRTIVINPRTYEIITYKHDDIRNVLPVTERAQQQCEDELRVPSTIVSPIITMTTTPPATTINNNTTSNTDTVTVFIAPTSNTFLSPTSTFQTASSNPVPTQSTNNSMTTKAEMYKPYIIAGVVVTVGMVLTIVLAGCCLKRRCLQTQHKKLQINSQLEKKAEPPLPVFNLTSSPKQVLRHLSLHDTVQDCSEQSQRQPLSSHA